MGSVPVQVLVLVLVLVAPSTAAQTVSIVNGDIVAVSGDIETHIAAAAREGQASWVAWRVPANDAQAIHCCWYTSGVDHWCGCSLDPDERRPPSAGARRTSPDGPFALETGTHVLLLARVAGGRVERIRSFSDTCPLDAGGRTVRLIDHVSADASVRWLAAQVNAEPDADEKLQHNAALAAIAATAGPAATAALDAFAAPSQPAPLRRRAIFWIGQSRGDDGFRTLRSLLAREDDSRTRRAIVQGMAQSKSDDVTKVLLDIAKHDPDAPTRGAALFWVAQRAGESVAANISVAAKNDPDARVQERAVMALSRLPADQGVPLLIDIARSHKNPRIQKRAMFWLGQSKDLRAVGFFEEILIGR